MNEIATCMHGFAPVDRSGLALHDAPADTWSEVFAEAAGLGFSAIEIADSHIRPGRLDVRRLTELTEAAASAGMRPVAVHVQRKSIIDPHLGEDNLAYAHATIDAAAALGCTVFSTGLHQPFSEEQKRALWFWTAPGWTDPDDPQVRALAVARFRELGEHAESVGLQMSLEMYEDTYLGTADSAVALIEEIGLDNVGLNPDIGNLIRLHRPIEDWREMYEKTLPYANYWHMKNYQRDEAGDGSWFMSHPSTLELGLIDYRTVVKRSMELGYTGPYLMEQYGGDSLGVCAKNMRYLEGLLGRTPESSESGAR